MTLPQPIDLLKNIEAGGCSAKLPAGLLDGLLAQLKLPSDPRILVDISSHDDAGVFRLNDETALVLTTDFFPPLCSDPFLFGKIAATNALSDIYAMGAKPLLALNLMMFPSNELPLEALKDILMGGQSQIEAAGAFIMGGHTIVDPIPKYGLAVLGTVHPDRLVSNAGLRVGDRLVLTKPLGTGVLIAAHRLQMASEAAYQQALQSMATLNNGAAEIMTAHGVRGATDITGFGLLGHAYSMALASKVVIELQLQQVPALAESSALLHQGCVPAGVWRNLEFVKPGLAVGPHVQLEAKLLAADAQTSGGLLMGVAPEQFESLMTDMAKQGIPAVCVGRVLPPEGAKKLQLS